MAAMTLLSRLFKSTTLLIRFVEFVRPVERQDVARLCLHATPPSTTLPPPQPSFVQWSLHTELIFITTSGLRG